jgi:hypothetical protein
VNHPQEKKLRIGHRSERGGINAARALLKRHGLVVDEVDGRSDYGRDLNVDITRDSAITGGIIGVQVKGGRTFLRSGRWVIPATKVDWAYWRASTVPIIGMVHDPDRGIIRWTNLTEAARSRVLTDPSGFKVQEQNDDLAEIVLEEVLDDDSFDSFITRTEAYLTATADSAYLLLLDSDDEIRRQGVFKCWTLGRRDPRPLILLRRVLTSLSGRSLYDGISVLAHATSHPDIFWTKRTGFPHWLKGPSKLRSGGHPTSWQNWYMQSKPLTRKAQTGSGAASDRVCGRSWSSTPHYTQSCPLPSAPL